jgi:hypothetical protein
MSDALRDHIPNAPTEPGELTDRDRRTLAEVLAGVPDPRKRRGVWHPFTPLLAATVAATLAGSRSLRRDRGVDR